MSKYGHRTGNWHESIVNKLGGEEAADAFLRDELSVVRSTPKWREAGGVIYFSVTSDGTTGEVWIARLETKGFRITDYSKQLLRHRKFKPTDCVTTEIAVLKGELLKGELFADGVRLTNHIRALARKRKLTKPNAEIACLIREKFSDKELGAMGLWAIIAMHDPIPYSGGGTLLLGADRYGDGQWLSAYYGNLGDRWSRDDGFAFAAAPSSVV